MRPPVVVRNIPRPDPKIVESLREAGVASVHGAQGRIGLMAPFMRPIIPTARIAGPAITVLCRPGDNLMINAAIEVCQKGDILVVGTTSESTDGMFGDMLGELCVALGIAGLIIDAGVRDVLGLTAMNFPVWAKAVSAQGTSKVLAGSVNVPTICAGELVRGGDIIVADPDGVCVVRRERAEEINEATQAKLKQEEHDRALYKAGTLSIDLGDKREKLKELGVEYVDELESYV